MAFPVPDASMACRCGRWSNKIHCPNCGGYAVLAMGVKHNQAVVVNGETIIVTCFKCRRCNMKFNDWEWRYRCEAPRFETQSMQQKRLRDEANVKLKTGRDAIVETAQRRGASPEEAHKVGTTYFLYKVSPQMCKEKDRDLLRKFTDLEIPPEETVQ